MKPKNKKRTWRWVSQDPDVSGSVLVWRAAQKPHLDKDDYGGWFESVDNDCVEVCAAQFTALFGVCPKPGQVLKVQFAKAKVIR